MVQGRDPWIKILMHIDINDPMRARISTNIWTIFVSEYKSLFQVVSNWLQINQYSINWSEIIDKQDLSK